MRVFVSSTFQDMHAEREELVKRVFPRLRAVCEQRRVNCTEIDLRWGVSNEQHEQGLALAICLAEIRDCRPFFIGMLGERYGWIPNSIEAETLSQYPWLAGYQGRSITELEMHFGALHDPRVAEHAFFYFRDPAAICSSDLAQMQGSTQDRHSATLLADLKSRIRDSGIPVRENYQSAKHFGELVYRDLMQRIDLLYPAASIPDELDRQAAAHEVFAQYRRSVFVGPTKYFERLDEHVAGNGRPLVVTGEPGCGKSAVLANWLAQRHSSHGDERRIEHFVGAASDSAYWPEILRRISGELWRQFSARLEIPSGVAADAERTAFLYRLEKFAAQGRFIVVIDGLEHLEQREGGLELDWLPTRVPTTCRLIVSTGSHRQLSKLCERGWPVLTVEPLDMQSRVSIVTQYLDRFGKTLSLRDTHRITCTERAANALYLRTLTEELRLFGSHEELDRRISHYLAASELDELFAKALERIEQDFAVECPGLVREAISLLWVARAGLAESELVELLGTTDPLPGYLWTQLRLAFGTLLVDRSGLLGIDAVPLRSAIKARYIPDAKLEDAARWRLVAYFEQRPNGPRKYAELPWQLFSLAAWDRLAAILTDPAFLETAWGSDARAVDLLWRQVESLSSINRLKAYVSAADWLPEHPHAVRVAVDLLRQWEASEPELRHAARRVVKALVESLVAHFCKRGLAIELAEALRLQIELIVADGRSVDRSELLELKDAYTRAGNSLGFVAGYRDTVHRVAFQGAEDIDATYGVFEEAAFEIGNVYYLEALFTEHAEALRGVGHSADCLELLETAERNLTCRAALAVAGCLRALFMYRAGRTQEADEVIGRVRELIDVDDLAESLEYVRRMRDGTRLPSDTVVAGNKDLTPVSWTSACEPSSLSIRQLVSADQADEMRQTIVEFEDAGDYVSALEISEQLTAAIRIEGHPKRLRNHLMITARLLKHLGREDESRRVAREIVHITSEHDVTNLQMFRDLLAELGLAG